MARTKTGSLSPASTLEIRKSTRLVDARADLSVMAQRLFNYAVSRLRGTETGEQTITFEVKELVAMIDTERGSFHEDLREAAASLVSTRVFIPEFDRNQIETGWTVAALVAAVTYNKGSSTLRLRFSSDITPYVVNLHNRFTKIELATVMKLRGRYTGRFFEWCKSRLGDRDSEGKIKPWTMDYSDLRSALGIKPKEYPRFVDFRRRILHPVERELAAQADLLLVHEPCRKDRAVVSLRFSVSEISKAAKLSPELPAAPAPPVTHGYTLAADPEELAWFERSRAERKKEKEEKKILTEQVHPS